MIFPLVLKRVFLVVHMPMVGDRGFNSVSSFDFINAESKKLYVRGPFDVGVFINIVLVREFLMRNPFSTDFP